MLQKERRSGQGEKGEKNLIHLPPRAREISNSDASGARHPALREMREPTGPHTLAKEGILSSDPSRHGQD